MAIKIAICIPSLEAAGAEGVMLNLANSIAGRGYLVDLVVWMAQGVLRDRIGSGVRLVDLGQKRVGRSFFLVRRYLRRERPDAVLSTLVRANIAIVMASRRLKHRPRIVLREANTTALDLCSQGGVGGIVLRFLAAVAYPLADGVVALSQDGVHSILKTLKCRADRVSAIRNPLDLAQLNRSAIEDRLHPWLVDVNRPLVVTMARLAFQKGVDVAIRAMSRLSNRSARLLVLGEGGERERLQALIESLGLDEVVHLMGFCDNPAPYLRAAAVFVSPSRFEGCPNALMQALAVGVPCVATNCPGATRELMAYCDLGEMVPVDSPDDMALAIDRLLMAEHKKVANVALMRDHESSAICDAYLRVLLPGASGAGFGRE